MNRKIKKGTKVLKVKKVKPISKAKTRVKRAYPKKLRTKYV